MRHKAVICKLCVRIKPSCPLKLSIHRGLLVLIEILFFLSAIGFGVLEEGNTNGKGIICLLLTLMSQI